MIAWSSLSRERRLYMLSAAVLACGLLCATLIYLNAPDDADGLAYEADGGVLYRMAPGDSRAYMHDMELYGGKTNVLVYEFRQWFAGLWRGRSLAYTTASIALLVSLGLFAAARCEAAPD